MLIKLRKTEAAFAVRSSTQPLIQKAKGVSAHKGSILIYDLERIDKDRLTETL